MNFHHSFITDTKQKTAIVKEVLALLPQWFGLPESTANYIKESASLPLWAAFIKEDIGKNTPLGFITLAFTSPYVGEIHCMGINPSFQRKGIGKELFEIAKAYAKEKGALYLQVKTVAPGNYKEYDQTVAFYEKMGFIPFEVFPTLWDKHNPCLILIQNI